MVTVLMVVFALAFRTVNANTRVTVDEGLSMIKRVALDKMRPLPAGMKIKALTANFRNRNALWVQLWKKNITTTDWYRMVWQIRVVPKTGDGGAEIIPIESFNQITLETEQIVGVVNDVTPGPLEGDYDRGSGTILSMNEVIGNVINIGQELWFDNLELPYHIPVYLCNTSDCAYVPSFVTPTTKTTDIATSTAKSSGISGGTGGGINGSGGQNVNSQRSSFSSFLLSDSTILGVIIWNIVLSCFVLVGIIILVMYLGRRRRKPHKDESNRYRRFSIPASVSNPPSILPSKQAAKLSGGIINYGTVTDSAVESRDLSISSAQSRDYASVHEDPQDDEQFRAVLKGSGSAYHAPVVPSVSGITNQSSQHSGESMGQMKADDVVDFTNDTLEDIDRDMFTY